MKNQLNRLLKSGSKINYEKKPKGSFIGRLRGKRPRFTKIPWVTDNIKSLEVFHGYNIETDTVWKTIINKMTSCTQIWKARNLTFKGKTWIFKNLFVSQMDTKLKCAAYQIDLRMKLTLLY
jgi:hypothetical protein